MVAISVFRDLVRMAAEVLAFQAPAQRVETLNEQSHASLTVTAIFGEILSCKMHLIRGCFPQQPATPRQIMAKNKTLRKKMVNWWLAGCWSKNGRLLFG